MKKTSTSLKIETSEWYQKYIWKQFATQIYTYLMVTELDLLSSVVSMQFDENSLFLLRTFLLHSFDSTSEQLQSLASVESVFFPLSLILIVDWSYLCGWNGPQTSLRFSDFSSWPLLLVK